MATIESDGDTPAETLGGANNSGTADETFDEANDGEILGEANDGKLETSRGPTAAVTGATGFLGTHLCRRLLADGWTVRGLARPSSDRDSVPASVEWVIGDVRDETTLRSLVDGTDAVFHLAGASLWGADPETVQRVNVDGTRSVIGACRECDAGRVVFTSTAGTRRPPEPGAVATEDDVAEPIGAYQSAKAAAEDVVDSYADASGDAVTVHPTSVFGPGDEKFTGPLLDMATAPTVPVHLPGGVSIVRVEDVVEGLLAAWRRGDPGEHYILGGENLTYRAAVSRIANSADGAPARLRVPPHAIHAAGPVAELVAKTTGRRVFPFDREMARLATSKLFYSSRKARERLGYGYEPIESAVSGAMAWHRNG